MKQTPAYKSIKVSFKTWQTLTRISAATGEPRTEIVNRLASVEEEALKDRKLPVVKGPEQSTII
jgi:hypothetical protein